MKSTPYESHTRSLLKGLSWRLWGTVITAVIAFLFTHNISLTLYISAAEFIGKIFLFYCHERLWKHIPYGISS